MRVYLCNITHNTVSQATKAILPHKHKEHNQMTENAIPQLSVSYTDQAEIPENFRSLYTERDGAYYLDAAPKSEVASAKREIERIQSAKCETAKRA